MISEYGNLCLLCNKRASEHHHLCYNRANRKLSDEDKLIIPLCRECHSFIHDYAIAGKLSKVLGQTIWELNYCADKERILDAREQFRKRYGKSYL